MKRWITLVVAGGAALLTLAAPMRAMGAGEEVRAIHAEGTCKTTTVWKLAIEPEVGVKVEATIESDAPNQDWHIVLLYNKHVMIDVVETTEDDGGFEVFRVENNAQGKDIATVQATNLVTGEVCWGRLQAGL